MKILDFTGRQAGASSNVKGSTCLTGTYRVGGHATAPTPGGPFHLTAAHNRASYVELLPDAVITFGKITSLSVKFHSYLGGAAMGSPRISVALVDDTGIERPLVIYLGDPPNFLNTDQVLNRYSGFNLVSKGNADRFDTSAFPEGGPFSTYADALAILRHFHVKRISYFLDTVGSGRDRDQVLYSIDCNVTLSKPSE